ncbi:hypothetical protein ACLK10_21615 [Escherichia coli]
MVLNVSIEALYWCNIHIVVQPFCTMVRMITPFRGNLKVGQISLYLFYGDTAKIIADFVTTTTMTNPGELKYVR